MFKIIFFKQSDGSVLGPKQILNQSNTLNLQTILTCGAYSDYDSCMMVYIWKLEITLLSRIYTMP